MRKRKRGEKESFQDFSLQSTKFRRSEFVGPRTKVHLLDEGYAWVIEFFLGLGGVLETSFSSFMLEEVGILPTLVYFPL